MNATASEIDDQWTSRLEAVVEDHLAQFPTSLAIAARLLARKGLAFPQQTMTAMGAQGRLAIFFDGLDEVVSIEKRAIVVRQINELVEGQLVYGNRFVVTSRPAALHVVNLLPTLHRLELQGFNEAEIRTLAERVLSLRLVESQEGVLLDEKKPSPKNSALIDKLLEDCRRNPGVARLAQNPLLLTLLILIYANSGVASAKRHRIYEDAIRTLSSVRGREAGFIPISAQDLRERLGAVLPLTPTAAVLALAWQFWRDAL